MASSEETRLVMYNNDMNTEVTIEGAERALDAGEWLNKQKINYHIDWPNWPQDDIPKYNFKFLDSIDAVFFKLKWQ